MLVLIYSHLNKLVTTFHLSLSMELPSIPTVISDPYLFDVPKDFLGSSESLDSASISKGLQISALTVVPLEMKTNSRYEVGGLGSLYLDHDVRFFQLLVQLNDLSGRSCLYTSGGPKSGWQTESNELEEIVAPSLQVKDAGRAGKSATWVGEENLVVEDGIRESSETEHQSLGQRRLYEQRLARRSSASCDPEDDPWTVDSHLLYDLASGAGTPNIIRGVELAEKQSLGQYLDTLKTRLDRKVETAFSPVQSLLELSSNRPIIEGLNDESLYLDESLHTVLKETHTNESGSTLVTTNLVPTNFFGTPNRHQHEGSLEGSALVLSDVYKGLLKDWVTPLSDEVPGRTRIARAKIAAQMAAELSFASIGVQLRPPVDPAPASQEEPATLALSTFNLPVHPQLQSPSSSGIGKGKQKQALPYPTPQPSSFDPPAILNSKRSGTAFVEDLASARLRFYTSLTPQPTLPPSLSSVLSHWTPGSDPANYTWAAPRVALAEPTLEERNIEAREISRQRKRRERLLKRQRADTLTASQPEPERPYGSQPTLAIRGLVSSQPTVEDHVPMSQAERGPHGGRLSTGKASRPIKKQKRPAGF